MEKKIRVALLMGGKSAEHEVSLQSARNIARTLDPEKYETTLIGIDQQGRWKVHPHGSALENAEDPRRIRLADGGLHLTVLPWNSDHPLLELEQCRSLEAPDVFFPILHGPFGEDGTLQGLLKMTGLPFVGSGVLGSAAAMDKDLCKRLLQQAGIPVARAETLHRHEPLPNYEEVAQRLGSTLFIKPANLGSSVGVFKVQRARQWQSSLEAAFGYDSKILVEEFIDGREIECSVLGNQEPQASVLGEVKPTHEFYSYEAKYLDEKGAQLIIPAPLPEQLSQKIRDAAVRGFRTVSCAGLARIDFFVDRQNRFYLNEINTLPGFTNISMYPKLWEASGISQRRLLDRLIELAQERHQQESQLRTSFDLSDD